MNDMDMWVWAALALAVVLAWGLPALRRRKQRQADTLQQTLPQSTHQFSAFDGGGPVEDPATTQPAPGYALTVPPALPTPQAPDPAAVATPQPAADVDASAAAEADAEHAALLAAYRDGENAALAAAQAAEQAAAEAAAEVAAAAALASAQGRAQAQAQAQAQARAQAEAQALAQAAAEAEAEAAAAAETASAAEAARAAREATALAQAQRDRAALQARLDAAAQEKAQREALVQARARAQALALEAQAQQARLQAQAEAAERQAQAEAQAWATAQAQALAQAELQALADVPTAPTAINTPRPAADTLVMVVDDSKVVRVKTSRLLGKAGFQVTLAADGGEALQQLQTAWPQVLITDVEMPGVDGFELTRQVRAQPQGAALPIVMITGADDRLREAAQAAGVTVLMGKPYSEEALLAQVAHLAGVVLSDSASPTA